MRVGHRVVSGCLLHSLEFRVFLLLNWLHPNNREHNIPCYLSYSWGGGGKEMDLYIFPIGISVKVNAIQVANFHFNLVIAPLPTCLGVCEQTHFFQNLCNLSSMLPSRIFFNLTSQVPFQVTVAIVMVKKLVYLTSYRAYKLFISILLKNI